MELLQVVTEYHHKVEYPHLLRLMECLLLEGVLEDPVAIARREVEVLLHRLMELHQHHPLHTDHRLMVEAALVESLG